MTEKFVEAGDSGELSELFGSLDGNLSHIQKKYNVSVVSRNGGLKIIGEQNDVDEASGAIRALMDMSGNGRALDGQTVRFPGKRHSGNMVERDEILHFP